MIYQIYQTSRAFIKTLNAAISSMDIYSSEWSIINLIKKNGTMPQTALVNLLQVEPAAISKTVAKLERKGIIKRNFLTDKREKFITLTPQAEMIYTDLKKDVLAHRKKAFKGLSTEERKTLYELMKKIYTNIEK